MTDSQSRAIFIDLDRSADSDARAEEYIGWYGKSLMYPAPIHSGNWTTKQVDYRQIAIMIGHIDGNNKPHEEPPDLSIPFLRKLFNEGKYIVCFCFFLLGMLLLLAMYTTGIYCADLHAQWESNRNSLE